MPCLPSAGGSETSSSPRNFRLVGSLKKNECPLTDIARRRNSHASPFPLASTEAPRMKLKILHLEDNADDVELVRHSLGRQGLECDIHAVASGPDYVSALER